MNNPLQLFECHSQDFSITFIISDETDVFILSPLCQEYQIDWLTDKIKSYILQRNVVPTTWSTSNTETVLKYLSLADTMSFGHNVEESVIDLINEPFQNVHMESQFLQLSQRIQILIARKLLWRVYMVNLTRIKNGVLVLSSVIDHALLLIFDDHQQKHLLRSRDRARLDSVIAKQAAKKQKLDNSGIDS